MFSVTSDRSDNPNGTEYFEPSVSYSKARTEIETSAECFAHYALCIWGPSISSWLKSARRGIAPDLDRVPGCARNVFVREIDLFSRNKTASHVCTIGKLSAHP